MKFTVHSMPPLLALLLLSACGGVGVQYLETNARASHRLQPRATNDVEVLTQQPRGPHTEVGILEARGQAVTSVRLANLIQALRAEGAAVGCDAVVVTDRSDATSENGGSQAILMGACIVYD